MKNMMENKLRNLIWMLFLALFIMACEKDEIAEKIKFSGGDGAQDNPYLISTAEDLDAIRNYPSPMSYKNFKQTNDIDLSVFSEGKGWEPIESFTGIYNGNGYKILNLTINRPDEMRAGLFDEITYVTNSRVEGRVANITLVDVKITASKEVGANASRYIGALASINNGTIRNCSVSGLIKATGSEGNTNSSVGVLVGANHYTIKNSHADIEIRLGDFHPFTLGGLVGNNSRGSIFRSFANGSITLTGTNGNESINNKIGGLVGSQLDFNNASVVSNCYATVDIIGYENDYIGGLIGVIWPEDVVVNSYAASNINIEGENTGGLIGSHSGFTYIYHSYWDVNTTGQHTSAGSDDSYGKTTEEMQTQSTYQDWDFAEIWDISEGVSYPFFRWQNK